MGTPSLLCALPVISTGISVIDVLIVVNNTAGTSGFFCTSGPAEIQAKRPWNPIYWCKVKMCPVNRSFARVPCDARVLW